MNEDEWRIVHGGFIAKWCSDHIRWLTPSIGIDEQTSSPNVQAQSVIIELCQKLAAEGFGEMIGSIDVKSVKYARQAIAILSPIRDELAKRERDQSAEQLQQLLAETDESPSPLIKEQAAESQTATLNARMFDILSKNPVSKEWSKRDWADRLGCSPSGIGKTRAWKSVMTLRKQARQELQDRTRKRFED